MDSPCIDVCEINPETGLCEGCARSLDEIAVWGSLSSTERRRVMSQLAARKARSSAR
jgi:uncharacterized protein